MNSEIAGLLCGLAFLLAIVTIVGHVSWLFFAAIFQAIFGEQQDAKPGAKLAGKAVRCNRCGRTSVQNGRCAYCGSVPLVSVENKTRDELLATARQLHRLQNSGHLTYEQCFALLKVLNQDLARFGSQVPEDCWPEYSKQPDSNPVEKSKDADLLVIGPETAPDIVAPFVAQTTARDIAAETPLEATVIEATIVDEPVTRALAAEPAAVDNPFALLGQKSAIASSPTPLTLPPEKTTPSRTLADMLQGFMEESNIRWGEVIAGLVIVISAIGLVISLRATLQHIPYFPALLFLLFTVSFHSAGLYTLRRWNLSAVSRAILIIAQLLVPLSFSAGVVLSGQGEAQRPLGDPLLMLALAIGLSLFGWVAYSGSRVLTGEGSLRLTTAIMGCCLAQVVINRGAAVDSSRAVITALGLLPVASFLAATIGQIWRAQAWRRMSLPRIEQTFLVLGISLFAILPPLGLLIFKSEPHWFTFARLAPLLSLVAGSILALGLVVHRRATAKSLATQRTAGTAIALLGGAAQILMWVVVWPRPELMLDVALLTGAGLLVIAIRTRMPALHAAAAASLSLAAVMGFIWWQQLVSSDNPLGMNWVQASLLGRTSLLLTILALLVGAWGAWLYLRKDRSIGLAYLLTAAAMSSLSLLVAGWSGFVPIADWTGDGDLTGPLFLAYAVALFVIAIRFKNDFVVSAAMALLWIALVQLLEVNGTLQAILAQLQLLPERRILMATLLTAEILSIIALVLSRPSWRLSPTEFLAGENDATFSKLIMPLTHGAAIAVMAASPFVLWVLPGQFAVHAIYAGLSLSIWAIVCLARRWPEALAAAQAMVAVTIAFAIAAYWPPVSTDQLWFLRGEHLQAQLLAIAASAGAWSLVRRLTVPKTALYELLHPKFPACDHMLLGLSVALLLLLTISSAWSGMAWELGAIAKDLTSADIPWLDQAHRGRLAVGLLVVISALIIALVDRITSLKLIGLSLAGWASLFLLAQVWQAEQATASAARWLFGIYGIVLLSLYIARNHLSKLLQTLGWLRWKPSETYAHEWFRFQSLFLGVLPLLALTIFAVAQNASGIPMHPPKAGSIFEWMGPTASYAGPILLGVVVFLGLAINQRQPAFAFGGGLLFQLAANLAFILHIAGRTIPESMVAAECLQWNILAASIYAVLWLGLAHWLLPRSPERFGERLQHEPCFQSFVGLGGLMLAGAILWSIGCIVYLPLGTAAEAQHVAHWSTLLALALLTVPLLIAVGVSRARRTWSKGASVLAILLAGAVPMMALRTQALVVGSPSLAYHLLELGWLFIAASVAGFNAWNEWRAPSELRGDIHSPRSRRGIAPHHAIAAILCGLIVPLAMYVNWDPSTSALIVAGVCFTLLVLGLARRSQPYAIATVIVAPLAALLPWLCGTPIFGWLGNSQFLVALNGCLLAAVIVGGWWQWIEIRFQSQLQQTFSPGWIGPRAGMIAIAAVTITLAVISAAHLVFVSTDWYWRGSQAYDYGLFASLVTWLLLGAVSIGTLWDRRATKIFPILFTWLWIACALGLAPLRLQPLPMFCLHALATAGVFALAGHLWSFGANLAAWGEKLGISDTIGGLTRIERWLPNLTLVVGLLICGLELAGMLNLPLREQRVAIALAPALIGYALACLAQQRRQYSFQLTALLLGGLACIYLGWSDLSPGWMLMDWMTRAFRLLMVLSVVTLGYGLVLPRLVFRQESWLQSSLHAGYVSSTLAIITLLGLLGMEIALFEPGVGAGIEGVQVAAVAVLLVLFIVGLISLALAPGAATPAEQQRRTYFVYGAQLVGGLLFAHLYLCEPAWFDGVLKPYWPFVIMAIAFGGVGLGEMFWRLRLPVLAEPFQRTGSFLPLLPILGLWVVSDREEFNYTILLFTAGMMYLILSLVRKSWAAAVAAAIAGNGALWSLLHEANWSILQHPQFWLIPPAVVVLIAAHINRKKLSDESISAIRYASLIVIYVSSTFEIFLHRAESSLWPPIILACLSLSGALAGVLLRIRAFLYLGAVFTLLAMVSMVWHAARAIEHVWPWWAFGIGMGIGILAMLAFFEKNRPQVQSLVTRLRQWDQ
ncbi:hypothetical protein ETAA8_68970 [Anatilimnocola aggregata]|uniref:Uncharacterized protein n=1 Tax=Anatilimnocola aggregata TaxID=2528021 RepID=A0A517YND5_9BACT|nr:hypothetical protein [Anatilimnocola aggregata]QDU31737.1 hypothetical protein ETAA8_68970 [Anatilimnocola aggregata]